MEKMILNVSKRAKSKVSGFAELVSKMFCRSLALGLNQLSVRIKTSSIGPRVGVTKKRKKSHMMTE